MRLAGDACWDIRGVLLLFLVSVLGLPIPGVTPASLLCKVVAASRVAGLAPERGSRAAGLS